MRNFISFAALMVGLLAAGSASAQSFGMGAQSAARTSKKIGVWDTSTSLSSTFRLSNLFRPHDRVLLPGGTNSNNARVSPDDPKYMQAFGFKKLYGPR